jgi:hypothetical protein
LIDLMGRRAVRPFTPTRLRRARCTAQCCEGGLEKAMSGANTAGGKTDAD